LPLLKFEPSYNRQPLNQRR